jgi:hypothetical protein
MDIPEVADAKPAKRRNFAVTGPDRAKLAIDGGTVEISGADISGPAYRFNGEFFGNPVSLGDKYVEQTDPLGQQLTRAGDPRITRVGKFLRRTSSRASAAHQRAPRRYVARGPETSSIGSECCRRVLRTCYKRIFTAP